MAYEKLVRMFSTLAGLLKPQSNQKEPGMVRGTHVYLPALAGFVEAPNFCGFINPTEKSSIMITEMPAPFGEIAKAFDAVGLSSRGMKLLSKNSVEVGAANGLLLSVQQKHLQEFHNKWVAVFGNSHQTVVITATFPADNIKIGETLREAILQAMWDPKVSVDPLADLTFVIQPPKGMILANRQHMMLMYTSDGLIEHKSSRDPLFIVGESVGTLSVSNLTTLARERLLQTTGHFDFEIKRERSITIDGLQAYEIDANAVDNRQSDPVAIYQVIIAPHRSNTYFIAQGIVHREAASQYIPAFETAINSFKLR